MTLDVKNVAVGRYSHVSEEVIELIERAKEFSATLESFPADILWRSARRTFPRSVVSTMRRLEKKWSIRSHKPSWYLLELILHLEREVEVVSSRGLGDNRIFYVARGLLPRYASFTRQSIDDIVKDWSNSSWALRELALDIGVPLVRRPSELAPSPIGDCERCWRTGHATYKGGYLCRVHAHGSAAYFEALRLDTWRAPDQQWNESYEMAVIRRLAGTVHTGVEPIEGLTAKYHLRRGNKRVLVGIRHHPVELAEWWDKFPYAQKFLKPKLRRAGLSMDDPEAVLHVLDPILGSFRDEQVLVHRALLRDQRQLLELLRTAEAWLETKAMMRSRWGGRRQKGYSVDAVERYAILSVRPARTLKAKPAPNPS